jgi:hypothetical protein
VLRYWHAQLLHTLSVGCVSIGLIAVSNNSPNFVVLLIAIDLFFLTSIFFRNKLIMLLNFMIMIVWTLLFTI